MGNPRAARDRVYVKPGRTTGDVNYGFLTNSTTAARTALGHKAVIANSPRVVFGANAPKPGRASKGDTNSFYDFDNAGTLKTAKWRLTPPKIRPGRNTTKTRAVYITINVTGGKIKYAWRMPVATYNAIGAARADLGIIDATATMRDLVWGTSQPRPSRATKIITIGTGQNAVNESYSTFVDDDAIEVGLPEGWTVIRSGSEIDA